MKKTVVGIICAFSMLAASSSVFAINPSGYDGVQYGDLGLSSNDPDGEINLAVIAKDDVVIGNTMYIKGSVYSGGEIYCMDGDGNKIDGLFISGTGDTVYKAPNPGDTTTYTAVGYKIRSDHGEPTAYSSKPTYGGAIYDNDTSFDCTYEAFKVPDASNFAQYGEKNLSIWVYDGVMTISEDSYFEKLSLTHDALIIDATNNPVTVIIDNFDTSTSNSPYLTVLGDNKVNVYINNVTENKFKLFTQKETGYIDEKGGGLYVNTNDHEHMKSEVEKLGNMDQVTFYLNSEEPITIEASRGYANIVCNNDIKIGESAFWMGDIKCGGNYTMEGTSVLWSEVCAPNSDTFIGKSAVLYGQLHTNTLAIAGAGAIINKADSINMNDMPEETTEPAEPTESTEPTETPAQPAGGEIFEGSSKYAYIFGDEPVYTNDPETGEMTAVVYMQPDRNVSREESCAMIMRLVDQHVGGLDADASDISSAVVSYSDWAAKGLGYLSQKGAYDIDYTVSGYGYPTRGEVAKLVALGLEFELKGGAIEFTDIAGNEFEKYINIMTSNGYMQGDGNGEFRPNDYMTRAEFCSMFNNVTGRTDYQLIAIDGSVVTPETYYIVDLDNADAWKVKATMLGTSAFTDNYEVDVDTRLANIRNVLDEYNGQTDY